MPESLYLIAYFSPFFTWVPIGLMAIVYRISRKPCRILTAFTGISFLLCAYEFYMDFVWSKKVITPIRLDLLLVIPFLSISGLVIGAGGFVGREAERSKAFTFAAILLIMLSIAPLILFI